MKLFISYGHDHNEVLVRRVKRDLESLAHCCWIDSDGLRKPDAHDWRRALMSALTYECEWTVGFLSQHAMRPNGVTAQELAIARDLKAGCVSTVLVEKQAGWQVPVAVGRAQWVDMSDWQEMQSQGEAAFEAWYAPKFAELANRLTADQAEAYAHEIGKLETWLEPVPQKADIDQHLAGFVGRDWLIKKLDNWRLQNVQDRLFWLAGAPGSGKTAFSAWITATHQANVVALNLCHYKLRDRCDAARVVRTLAFFLCRRVEDYRLLLLQLMPKFDRDRLSQSNASSLFDQLIAQPLAHCFDGNLSADRLLIVIDGLDEAVDNEKLVGGDGHQLHALLDVLRDQARRLPKWVGLVVTSRPDQPAKTAFDGVPKLRIDEETADNFDDLMCYVADWLKKIGKSDAEIAVLAPQVVEKAEGSFIYLRLMEEASNRPSFDFLGGTLPDGLSDLYDRWFTRQFPDESVYERDVEPSLALILAASTPVPEQILDEAMGWDRRQAVRIRQSLGSLFVRRDDRWTPFHKSLRDWLVSPDTPARHVVDVTRGRTELTNQLWRQFLAAAKDRSVALTSFLIAELPDLASQQKRSELAALLGNGKAWGGVAASIKATIELLRDRFDWTTALAWCALGELCVEAASTDGDALMSWIAMTRGDMLIRVGRLAPALDAYHLALRKSQQLGRTAVVETQWRRDLSNSHGRCGDAYLMQGNVNEALEAFRAAREVLIGPSESGSIDPELQQHLSEIQNSIGNALLLKGDLIGAGDAYRSAMEISLSLVDSDTDNPDWLRHLSRSHNRLGGLRLEQGDIAAACDAYASAVAVSLDLAERNPDNIDWKRDLSVSHHGMGDAFIAQGNYPSALRSLQSAMEICSVLARMDPVNVGWQGALSNIHNSLSVALQAQRNLKAAIEASRAASEISASLAHRCPEYNQFQRGVVLSQNQLGSVSQALEDRHGALSAFRAAIEVGTELAQREPDNIRSQRDLFASLVGITNALIRLDQIGEAAVFARRLQDQASLMTVRFPQDRQREAYVRTAKLLVDQTSGAAA